MLGLPRTLSGKDIDQELPLEIDDETASDHETQWQLANPHISEISSSGAHVLLVQIVARFVKYIYNTHPSAKGKTGAYGVE